MDSDEQKTDVITIVLTADNHLGATVPGYASRKREVFRQRLRQAFQQATDFAIGQGVDLFVQVGDLFDNTHPDEQDRNFVAARLAELKQAGIRAFALGGAHDTPARDQRGNALPAPHMSFARLGALHYFPPQPEDGPEADAGSSSAYKTLRPVLLDVRGTLVGLCGLGVAGQHEQGDPLAGARVDDEIERAALPILLLSAPIEGIAPDAPAYQMVSQDTIAAQSAFRIILAGYAHRYRRLTIGQTELVIAGATQQVEFDEAGESSESNKSGDLDSPDVPGFVFLGVAADGIRWCRHIDIDSIGMRSLTISTSALWPRGDAVDGTSSAPAISPTERILEQLRTLCDQETIVQLRLVGELSRQRYHELEMDAIRRYGEAHTFAFSLDDSALTFSFDDDAGEPVFSRLSAPGLEERLSPREELIALADEWIAKALDEQEKSALIATKEELLSALWSTTKA